MTEHDEVPNAGAVPWDAFPSEAEAEELARTNPKGALWTLCARAKGPKPKIAREQRGSVYGASMTLRVQGRELESGMCWAWEPTLAEQMAARALLRALAVEDEDSEPAEWVTADDATRLRAQNPKGALLERVRALRLQGLRLECQPIATREGVAAWEASACVRLPSGDELWSDLRRADDATLAEHAASASLLARLGEKTIDEVFAATPASRASSAILGKVGDPRSLLNELRQVGRVDDYGFAVASFGEPHAPVFSATGYVVRGGERLEVADVRGPTKKEAERLAALALVERLRGA